MIEVGIQPCAHGMKEQSDLHARKVLLYTALGDPANNPRTSEDLQARAFWQQYPGSEIQLIWKSFTMLRDSCKYQKASNPAA